MKHPTAECARRIRCGMMLLAMLALAASGAILEAQSAAEQAAGSQSADPQSADQAQGLVIKPAELPTTYPRAPYHFKFLAQGNYVPVLHWTMANGALPQGMKLEDDGTLHGEAQRAGEFQFTVAAKDGGQPQQAVQRQFVLKVVEALTIGWKIPARVNGSRIEGSVEVSNTTPEDIDLTFDVKAVAENGRATEIGYQHFALKQGTTGMPLPFGETLPNGGYIVNVNVVGEVAARNAIYRQMLQTPKPLHVTVGP